MKKPLLILLCVVLFSISKTHASINTEFEKFAVLQDSLMVNAYKKRDVKTQEKLQKDFSDRYENLSGIDRARFQYFYYNSFYNLCCTYALLNNKEKAAEYMAKTIKAGYLDYSFIKDDTDLNNVKNDKQFMAVIQPLKEIYYSTMNMQDSYNNSSLDSAIIKSQQAVLITLKYKNVLPAEAEARYLAELASLFWNSGNFPEAKGTYLVALKKAELINDPLVTARIYTGLAVVARNAGDYRQALRYYDKAASYLKDMPDNDNSIEILTDKGRTYEKLNILDSAFTLLQECHAMLYRMYHGINVFGGGIHAESGIIYSKMGKKELAEDYFRQAIQLNAEANNFRIQSRTYIDFAEHFDRFNMRDSAIYYATKSLSIIEQHKFLVYKLAASTLLAKLYAQQDKIDSAFKYQSLMIATQNTMFSNDKMIHLQSMEFNEQLRQQELEADKLNKEEERKNNIQFILIAIGLFTFIILFLLLSRSFITNTKLIEFIGILALLLVFEFLNLLLHPFIENITHHSPVLMLLAMVIIAALLIPLHHRVEKWAIQKLVEKNKRIRLARAKKTVEELSE
jgi:tetratricopeptide (TPR) repeat protein